MTERTKNSLVLGGLTSSAGVFLTKVIGILYVVPFSALATEANLSYYARAYNIYEIVLNVSIAGIPFAIATLVAKYQLKEKYKTVLLVRKLSTAILAVMGFVMMIGLMVFALPIAQFSVAGSIDSVEVLRTKNVMMIMALAVFTVPLLSSYRGFYQGLKELKLYASSQVIEQIARVAFLLGLGFILVVLFKMDAIWAVYAAIFSTSVAALASMLQFILKDRKTLNELKEKALLSVDDHPQVWDLTKELYSFSIPFLLNVLLNSLPNFINLMFFNQAMVLHGETIQQADLYYSLVMFTTNKLTSIPQVVAPGFITAIIPYVTTSFEKKDFEAMRHHVIETIVVVCYLSLPLSFFLYGISAPIYYVMYGKAHLDLGSEVLKLNSITGLTFNLAAVSNALMMALRLRKQNLAVSFFTIVLAALTFVPLMAWIGYSGSIVSKIVTQIAMFGINLLILKKHYQVMYTQLLKPILWMVLGLMGMQLSFWFLDLIGLHIYDQGRILATFELAIYGVVGVVAYGGITAVFKLPQTVLHLDFKRIKERLTHAS